MSDRSETLLNGREDVLKRLRDATPPDAQLLCGYPGEGPPGYDRIYTPNRIRYVDVPRERIRERHPVPASGPGGNEGIVLFVDRDVPIRASRTTPAELLVGPISTRLERLAEVAKCWTSRTRTPKHHPFSEFLDPP